MSEPERNTIAVTPSRVAFVLSLITLLGIGFQGSKFLLDTNYRITSLEEKWVGIEKTQADLSASIGELSKSLNDLNLVLREVKVRQEATTK